MTIPFAPAVLVERIGWILVHSVWQFALLALLLAVALRVLRRSASGARYAAALVGWSLMLAAPLLTWPLLPDDPPIAVASAAPATPVGVPPAGGQTILDSVAAEAGAPAMVAIPVGVPPSGGQTSVDAVPANTGTPTRTWSESLNAAIAPWLNTLVVIWCLGVCVFAARSARGWHIVRRLLRRDVQAVPDELTSLLVRVLKRVGLRHRVRLLQSPHVDVPLVVGWLRPVILLPVCVATGFSPTQLEAILAHELAHIRRHDYLINLLQTLSETVFFYHPALWWASAMVRREREHCCDELAARALGNPAEYGRALLALEELRGETPTLALGAKGGSLLERIRRLAQLEQSPRLGAGGVIGIALVAVLVVTTGMWVSAAVEQTPDSTTNIENQATREESKESQKSAASDTPDGFRTMTLITVDESGHPVPDVRFLVNASASDRRGVSTTRHVADANGRLTIQVPVPLSLMRIWTQKLGYVPLFAQWWPEKQPDGADLPDEYTFTLPTGTTIGGVIRNAVGDPIENAEVDVKLVVVGDLYDRLRHSDWLTEEAGPEHNHCVTDASGRWSLDNVPAGEDVEVELKVRHPDYISDDDYGELQKAQRISMPALRDQTAAIAMVAGIKLHGRITDPDGKPVSGASVVWGQNLIFENDSHEVTSDADGRFESIPLPAGPVDFTVVAEGWKPVIRTVDLQPDTVVDLQVERGNHLRAKLVDSSGTPISNAWIRFDNWGTVVQAHMGNDHNQALKSIPKRTNADGIFDWTWAPDEILTYRCAVAGHAEITARLAADGSEHVVTVPSLLTVSGTARNAASREQVSQLHVSQVHFFRPDFPYVNRSDAVDSTDGSFTMTFDRTDTQHGILIEADGFRSQIAGPWKIGDPNPVLNIELEPATAITGRIALPDGAPVANVDVLLGTYAQHLDLYSHRIDEDALRRKTGENGAFAFPAQSGKFSLIAIHDAGYAEIALEPDQLPGTLTLQPWARVAGRVLRAGQPVAGQRVFLEPIRPRFSPEPRIDERFSATTDDDGRFSFARVPPVKSSVRAWLNVFEDAPIIAAESVPLDLQPGQTVSVDLNGAGATVKGRVTLTGETARDIDLNYSLNWMLHLQDGISPPPALAAKGFTWQDGWNDAWMKSIDGQAYPQTLHHYFVKLGRDGSFTVDGVPPGDYDLAFQLYAPPEPGGCLVQPAGTRHVRFTVTPKQAAGTVELGDVPIQAHLGPEPGDPTPDIVFETLDGSRQALSAYRGKFVLLDFWATWCAACLERQPALHALADEYATDGRFALVSLNLDEDPNAARGYVRARNLSGDHGFLGDWSNSDVPLQLGIGSIPVYLLIGPDGRLLHRGFQIEELRSAILESLNVTARTSNNSEPAVQSRETTAAAVDETPTSTSERKADEPAATDTVQITIVQAKHVLLLDGAQIVTWQDIDEKIAALPDPSRVHPQLYVTRGAMEAELWDAAWHEVGELSQKYKLGGQSVGSLTPRTDIHYDRIKTPADLVPDPSLRREGTVVDKDRKPIAGAEVILITPVDESLSYKAYDIYIVSGHVRNPYDEVLTRTDDDGWFAVHPPASTPFTLLALHPEHGVAMVDSDSFTKEPKLTLLTWGGIVAEFSEEPEPQSASLRTNLEATDTRPEITLTQYWVDLNRPEPTLKFEFTHVPPIWSTSVQRNFAQPDGGSTGIHGASLSVLPGETQSIKLGPVSQQQRELLKAIHERRLGPQAQAAPVQDDADNVAQTETATTETASTDEAGAPAKSAGEQTSQSDTEKPAVETKQADPPPYPVLVSTEPPNGALDVDPSLEWITVTFDRDMSKGMSWTGDIPTDRSRKAVWKDARTCVLPVTLTAGAAYRIGINSRSYRNFASQGGEPTPPTAIYFATQGTTEELQQTVKVPKIVSLEPVNSATDVDPATTQLAVTFDMPMGDGMSWVGGGESFPIVPEGQTGSWSEDRRTCTLPVVLKPGHTYQLGLNAPKFQNFQSEHQVPLEPVVYTFTTRAADPDQEAAN